MRLCYIWMDRTYSYHFIPAQLFISLFTNCLLFYHTRACCGMIVEYHHLHHVHMHHNIYLIKMSWTEDDSEQWRIDLLRCEDNSVCLWWVVTQWTRHAYTCWSVTMDVADIYSHCDTPGSNTWLSSDSLIISISNTFWLNTPAKK